MNLDDKKICVITGNSRGLGKSLSEKLFSNDYEIISINRNKPDDCYYFYECDLSDVSNINSAVEKIKSNFTKIDLLVNNAGVFHESEFEKISLEDWFHVMQVNVTAPFLLTQLLLPLLKKSESAKIINISSTAGLEGKVNQSVYCSSKHALMGLFRSLKIELKEYNISVHNICTGGLNTEFTFGSNIYNNLKNQTLLDVNEISDMIFYLISCPKELEISELIINRFKKT